MTLSPSTGANKINEQGVRGASDVQTSVDRILTTHVGSLVRTPALVEAHIKADLTESLPVDQYQALLAKGVREVVSRQVQVGVDVVDDGEYGKVNWITYLGERLGGLESRPATREMAVANATFWPEQNRFDDFYRVYGKFETMQWLPETPSKARYTGDQATDYMRVACTGALTYNPEPLRRDIENLKDALKGHAVTEAFMPVVAPGSVEMVPNLHYGSVEDYLNALADVLNTEYRMIVEAGFVLQVDDAIVPAQFYYQFRGRPLTDYLQWAEVRIAALNRALRGIPQDRVRYHICFGSQNMPHTTDPALADLIALVLKVNAQGYSIEACNPRHEHEWLIWKDVKLPVGKVLIPGVISHATNIVEHPELIALRLKNFASLVGRENVIASSDCGFSQGWNSPRVHSQIQWAKLEALVEGARLASRHLWH